jgi:2-polyprenyl-3-methyl-5-hydroxy-6-metoxy-1,4-benzoquinol methylase
MLKMDIDIFRSAIINLPDGGEDGVKHLRNDATFIMYIYYLLLIKEVLPNSKGIKIFDWGGQYGHVSYLLNRFGYDAINYVYNLPLLFDKVEKDLGIKYMISTVRDPNNLASESNSYDAVISSGVLEHVKEYGGDEVQILEELKRITKQDGFLFIWNLPSKYSANEGIKQMIRKGWTHPIRYSGSEIAKIIQRSGWEIVFHDKHEFLPMSLRSRICQAFGASPCCIFIFDYYLSKLPVFNLFYQHHTIICRNSVSGHL